MRSGSCWLVGTTMFTLVCSAQNPAPQQNPAPPAPAVQPVPIVMQFTPGTLIPAQLEETIDARKAKVGEKVIAKTLDDLKSVPPGLTPKNCRVIGHVVEVVSHQGSGASMLRIVFDKMILKNGSDMALPAIIQAVGFVENFDAATNADAINHMGATPSDNRGVNGASSGPIGSPGGNPGMYEGQRMSIPRSGNNSDERLPLNAVGPIGMPGVSLNTGSERDSILTSKKKNVKLESGMQMILRTN